MSGASYKGRRRAPIPTGPTIEQIFALVAEVWGIDISTMRTKQQGSSKAPAHARQLAAYLCCQYGWHCDEIAPHGRWKNRHGSRVAANTARAVMPYDRTMREKHDEAVRVIRNRYPQTKEH